MRLSTLAILVTCVATPAYAQSVSQEVCDRIRAESNAANQFVRQLNAATNPLQREPILEERNRAVQAAHQSSFAFFQNLYQQQQTFSGTVTETSMFGTSYTIKFRLNGSCDLQVTLGFNKSDVGMNDFQRMGNIGGGSGNLDQYRNILQTINTGDLITVTGRFKPPGMPGFNATMSQITDIHKGN
jgi:hypothetical protein